MNGSEDIDEVLAARLRRIAPTHAPDDVLVGVLDRTVALRQRRRGLLGTATGGGLARAVRVSAVGVVIAAATVLGLQLSSISREPPPGIGDTGSETASPSPASPGPSGAAEEGAATVGDLAEYQLQGWEDEEVLIVAKSRETTSVLVVGLDGEVRAELASLPTSVNSVQVSPDRTMIAYDDRDTDDIHLLDIASGETRRLTDAPTRENRPSWSPDGTRIAYDVDEYADPRDCCAIEIVNTDGSGREIILQGEYDWDPVWSPDGARLAFVRYPFPGSAADPDWEQAEIFVIDLGTRALTQVTDLPLEDFTPSWSPDGRRIAFAHHPSTGDDDWDIWVVDLATLVAAPVIEHADNDEVGTWSPDGSRLVFASDRRVRVDQDPDPGKNIWIAWADGTGDPARLFSSSSAEQEPDWRAGAGPP